MTAVTKHLPPCIGAELPSEKTQRRLVDKTKAELRPSYKQPASAQELVMTPELKVLSSGNTFLLHDSGKDNGERFLMFATRDFLARMAGAKEWQQVFETHMNFAFEV